MADRLLKSAISAFKTSAVYTPAGRSSLSLSGVFRKSSQASDPQAGAMVDSFRLTFGVRLADLPVAPKQGDRIVVKTISYRVIEVEEDGEGGAELQLNQVD